MRKLTLALAAAALLAAAPPASAADYTVTGGKLDWTIANQFTSLRRPGPDVARLRDVQPGRQPGRVQRHRDADRARDADRPDRRRRASVDADSARGARPALHVRLPGQPPAGRTATRASAASRLRARVTFTIHGIPITVVDPLVTLNGADRHAARRPVSRPTSAASRQPYDRSDDAVQPRPLQRRGQAARRRLARDHRDRPAEHADTALVGLRRRTRRRFGTMSLTLGLEPVTGRRSARDRAATAPPAPAGKDRQATARDADAHA